MNATIRLVAVVLATSSIFGMTAISAHGAVTIDFEAPTFSSGNVVGQDGWTGSNPSATRVLTATEIAAELTNAGLNPVDPVHGGSQALLVSATSGSSSTVRPVSGFETSPVAVLDLWARPLTPGADGSSIGTNLNNIFFTMEDANGARAAAVRFGASVDGDTIESTSIDAYSGEITGGWFATGVDWQADTWYNLRMIADYSAKTYNVFVDGNQVAGDVPFYSDASTSLSQIRVFRGSGQAGVIVDNIRVVPEPGALSLLLLASSLLALKRRGR